MDTPPADISDLLTPGRRVTVIQQMQLKGWTNRITGTVEGFEQSKTGSWYAHAKDDRLWLDRLTLELDDGEIVAINLDRYSRIEPADELETGDAGDPNPEAA